MAVYTAIFGQYWSWKQEFMKHLTLLNGLGLTASATLAGTGLLQGKAGVAGAWIWLFTLGLYAAVLALGMGSQDLRMHRKRQIEALILGDADHPEMQQVLESPWFKWLGFASLAFFLFGAGWLSYALS
ncbi:hypothetical protein BKK80_13500 [Cupriavidus malaysiensis]|uniref:DUF2269 family protein n=2 Tax=Cupriavidus malaysiensis TaxID=367825 RepID=A0ABN4TNS7_9BURK|nr:hypothetical protein BKK80_13500 [Cupriavidus malaysiensis]